MQDGYVDFDSPKLYAAVDAVRQLRNMSWDEVEVEACVARSTIRHLHDCKWGIGITQAVRLLHWLGMYNMELFMKPGAKAVKKII